MRTSTLVLALVSALVLAGAGVGGVFAATPSLHAQQSATDNGTTTAGGGASSGSGGAGSEPSITFDDQDSSGGSIVVQSATLPEKGFVVINGTPTGTDRVIGSSYPLNAGTSDNIRIQLDRSLNGSQSLTAVLYADSNGNGQFDSGSGSGEGDQPIYLGNSDRRVVSTADVSVPSNNAGSETQTASGEAATTANSTTGTNATTRTNATTQPSSSGDNAATTANANESGANGGNQTGGNESGGSGGNQSGGGSGAFGPGFGPVVAVVALLAVALFVRRR